MDVEAMAHAMFSAYHAHYGRFRDWKRAPMQDVGPEMGKQTFLLMAQAVADMPAPEVEATVDGESYRWQIQRRSLSAKSRRTVRRI